MRCLFSAAVLTNPNNIKKPEEKPGDNYKI